ncbi:hypothetical protein MKW92_019094, partial [Papaver armeniacum]
VIYPATLVTAIPLYFISKGFVGPSDIKSRYIRFLEVTDGAANCANVTSGRIKLSSKPREKDESGKKVMLQLESKPPISDGIKIFMDVQKQTEEVSTYEESRGEYLCVISVDQLCEKLGGEVIRETLKKLKLLAHRLLSHKNRTDDHVKNILAERKMERMVIGSTFVKEDQTSLDLYDRVIYLWGSIKAKYILMRSVKQHISTTLLCAKQWFRLVFIILKSVVTSCLKVQVFTAVLSMVAVQEESIQKEQLVITKPSHLSVLYETINRNSGQYIDTPYTIHKCRELKGVQIMAFVFDRGKSKQKPYDDKLINSVAVLDATVGTSNLLFIRTTNTKQLGQKLLGKLRRIWLLACRDSTTRPDKKLVCAEYQDTVTESMLIDIPKSGIRNEDLGFVFDRGKVVGISYDTDNITCSLHFRISKVLGFVLSKLVFGS